LIAPAVLAGVAGAGVMVLAIGVSIVGGAASSSAADPGTALLAGPLAAGAVPDPALLSWVSEAGSLCPVITPAVIAAQTETESGWDPTDVSPAGAEGIAQFLPGTWPSYGGNDDGAGDVSPFNPADAIMAEGRYDCALAAEFAPLAASSGTPDLSLALAGYNAGAQAVTSAGGIPPIPATQAYVSNVESLSATYVQSIGTPFGAAVVAAAAGWLGTPYLWGGGGYAGPTGNPAGFDCSGLVMYAIYQASHGAVSLPHSAEIQATLGESIPIAAIEPGDVIALQLSTPAAFDHVVIYIGGDQVIAAPHTGGVVQVEALSDFANAPYTVRRFG
jgi:cell wall-associated NlpC family hydrolase